MSHDLKYLVASLLQPGHYLVEVPSLKRKKCWKLFKGRAVPVAYVAHSVVSRIEIFLKEDSKKRSTLNKSLVRQANGNTIVKRIYNNKKLKPVAGKVAKKIKDGIKSNHTQTHVLF